MSRLHPELGYAKSTRLLKDEGWQVGNRMVQRLRREVGVWLIPTKKPRKRRQGISTGLQDQGYAPQPRLIEENGVPEYIRSDNGSEFIEKNLHKRLSSEGIKTLYIEPGSPWQNGYIESFHGRFREECLNREQLWTLTEARVVIGDWRWKYNNIRPHRSLGYISPIKFAQQIAETQEATEQGSGSTRPMASFRKNLDFLYNLNHTIITSRLTNQVAQFG